MATKPSKASQLLAALPVTISPLAKAARKVGASTSTASKALPKLTFVAVKRKSGKRK